MSSGGYALLDAGDGAKLERFGEFVLQRPCAQAVWKKHDAGAWSQAHAIFERSSAGTGTWRSRDLPSSWSMEHADLTWKLAPNEHGNVGIFPEQAVCWEWIRKSIATAGVKQPEILNVFGYSGGSTFAAARAGARVCHVDASKTIVKHAREMAELSKLDELPVRWIVDDATRFLEREKRRERRYHGIILDPPTYGRGPKGEVWKIDEGIQPLLRLATGLLHEQAFLFLLTSHSPGYTPLVLENLLVSHLPGTRREDVTHGEMTMVDTAGRPLPSGAYAGWSSSGGSA